MVVVVVVGFFHFLSFKKLCYSNVTIIFLFIEPLVKNATNFVRSGPTEVVGIINASKTSTSSLMTTEIIQTSVPHLHSSVKGMITILLSLLSLLLLSLLL